MQRVKTAIFIMMGILCLGTGLYVFLPDRNLESVETTAFVKQEQVEKQGDPDADRTAVEEEKQIEVEEKNDNSITHEVKAKVRKL